MAQGGGGTRRGFHREVINWVRAGENHRSGAVSFKIHMEKQHCLIFSLMTITRKKGAGGEIADEIC